MWALRLCIPHFWWRENPGPLPQSLPVICLPPQIADGSTKGKVLGTAELGTVSVQGAPPPPPAGGEARGWGQAAPPVRQSQPLSTHPCAQVANGPEGQNFHSELHIFPASSRGPEDAQSAAFPAERARSPSALAPGECLPGSWDQRREYLPPLGRNQHLESG